MINRYGYRREMSSTTKVISTLVITGCFATLVECTSKHLVEDRLQSLYVATAKEIVKDKNAGSGLFCAACSVGGECVGATVVGVPQADDTNNAANNQTYVMFTTMTPDEVSAATGRHKKSLKMDGEAVSYRTPAQPHVIMGGTTALAVISETGELTTLILPTIDGKKRLTL